MTLTLKSNDDAPEVCVRRLYNCFRNLRQRAKIKKLLTGGIAFLELTYSPERRQYHPHLHIIWQGHYVAHAMLRNEWLSVTQDSYIVDVRSLPRPDHAVSYVAKYATKSIGPSIWRDAAAFVQVIRGLARVRTLFTWGSWRGFKLLSPPEDDTAWQTLGKLDDIARRAAGGDEDARVIMRLLNRYIPGNENADERLLALDDST
jgi:hypothetical protein